MGKITGFKEFLRENFYYQPKTERIKHFNEFITPLDDESISKQGARCMNCGIPFCHNGCPLGNIIPDFNDLVYIKDYKQAHKKLSSTNNFPEFTGRVCPAPCESACTLGINKDPVAIKSIEYTIAEKAFELDLVVPTIIEERSGFRVAIVGSGPAGLAAADQLNKAGHLVTVFERENRLGGLLRYGVPNFKLDKEIIDRRIKIMKKGGIVFRCNANVGVNIQVAELQQNYDAIILAGGSTVARDISIRGRKNSNVYFAMEFLTQAIKRIQQDKITSKDSIWVKGKDVVVIGGGDTGSDCIGTSFRQGAKTVTQIDRNPQPPTKRNNQMPWPTHPKLAQLTSSQEEGAKLIYGVITKEFLLNDEGKIRALNCIKVKREFNKNGSKKFVEVGEAFEIKADIVFLAMGFKYPEKSGAIADMNLELDHNGNVKTNCDYMTSCSGVFSAGDMRIGQSLVVDAISEGRECAVAVDKYLKKEHTVLFSKAKSGDQVLDENLTAST